MRTKAEILNQALKGQPAPGSWDTTASLNERLQIEVLIDIRDILKRDMDDMIKRAIHLKAKKGGGE